MKTTLRYLLPVLLLCGLCSPVLAETAREQLDRFSDGLETLHARFEQVVVSSDGKVQDSSGGEVWLRSPDRFRWSYGGDFPELVVSDGKNIWIYDEMLEQVTVKDHSEAGVNSPLSVLSAPERLDEAFEVREVGATADAQLLELRSRSMETQFERFLLGMKEGAPSMIIMEDAFGLRTEIRFSGLERNIPIDDGLFEFTPPPGVDVIGALPGGG